MLPRTSRRCRVAVSDSKGVVATHIKQTTDVPAHKKVVMTRKCLCTLGRPCPDGLIHRDTRFSACHGSHHPNFMNLRVAGQPMVKRSHFKGVGKPCKACVCSLHTHVPRMQDKHQQQQALMVCKNNLLPGSDPQGASEQDRVCEHLAQASRRDRQKDQKAMDSTSFSSVVALGLSILGDCRQP